jgi:hypothetical protein
MRWSPSCSGRRCRLAGLAGPGFADGFFAAVRTLVQQGSLTWVSASRHSLHDAFKSRGLTSRFLNDTLKLWIGALSRTAAHELARRAGTEAARGW